MLLVACGHASTPSPPPPAAPEAPAPSPPPPPAEADPGASADAGASAPLRRITEGRGCTEPGLVELDALPPSRCSVAGAHAFVFGIVVPLGDGTFLELGLYGGSATVEVPATLDARARVKVTAPLEVEGTTSFDLLSVALVHRDGGQVHPTLRLAPGAPLVGVAVGERLRAKALFGTGFAVGPLDLPCSSVALGDHNEVVNDPKPDRHDVLAPKGPELRPDPKDEFRLAGAPRTGVLRAGWQGTPPLVKASIDANDGVRLADTHGPLDGASFMGNAALEVLDRKAGHLRIRARSVAGSELAGWVKEDEVYVQRGGRGEGIGLCGCARGPRPRDSVDLVLARGATVHARPNGPRWARAPSEVKVVAAAASNEEAGWRRLRSIAALSEGGDGCPSGKLEHAWVRASDLRAP